MKRKGIISGVIETVLSLLLTVGTHTFFKACEAEEGHFMNCHWAQNAVMLAGAVLTVLSLLRVFILNRDIRTGLSSGVFTLSVSVIFIPETLINLCMMETMRCHTVFKPAVIITASVLAVISGIDAVTGLLRSGKGNGEKK